MMLVLDLQGAEPTYLQIYQTVVDAVAGGRLREGEALPSTRQLARDLGVNYHTVHRAYDLLLASGVITMEPRRRAVVASAGGEPGAEWVHQWTQRVRALIAEAIAVGLTPAGIRSRLDDALPPA